MELYVFDRAAGLMGVVDDAFSVRWRRKYFEPGEAEVHVPAERDRIELLAEGRILKRRDRVEAAIIEGVAIDGTDLTVTGRMLSSLLDRAILRKTHRCTGPLEEIMLQLAEEEGGRVLPELTAAEPEEGSTGPEAALQITYQNLLAVEERLARAAGLGFRVRFDAPGAMVFEVYRGVDRSTAQQARPVVIFSDEFGNLADPRYTKSAVNFKNKAYVAGEGEGADRIVEIVDETAGEEAREVYVDARQLRREEGVTEAEYRALLGQKGREALASHVRVESFEGGGDAVGNFLYRADWDLGDIVTVQYARLGITLHARVTEVEEVCEGGVTTYTPVFGTPLPEKLQIGDETV